MYRAGRIDKTNTFVFFGLPLDFLKVLSVDYILHTALNTINQGTVLVNVLMEIIFCFHDDRARSSCKVRDVKLGTRNESLGTIYSAKAPENSKWQTKEKKREQ